MALKASRRSALLPPFKTAPSTMNGARNVKLGNHHRMSSTIQEEMCCAGGLTICHISCRLLCIKPPKILPTVSHADRPFHAQLAVSLFLSFCERVLSPRHHPIVLPRIHALVALRPLVRAQSSLTPFREYRTSPLRLVQRLLPPRAARSLHSRYELLKTDQSTRTFNFLGRSGGERPHT